MSTGTGRGTDAMHINPIDAAQAVAGRYHGAALQRSRIIARLLRGPASRPELERVCGAPSVTKRISELRRMGFQITGGWAPMTGPDGTVNVVMVYALAERDDRQGDLFAGADTR